jgi:hypothetical protein
MPLLESVLLNLKLDYQGFFPLTNLDKASWMRLSLSKQRSAREKPDDFHPTAVVHQRIC